MNNIRLSGMVLLREIAYKLINFCSKYPAPYFHINRVGSVWQERLFGKTLNGIRRRFALSEDGVQ